MKLSGYLLWTEHSSLRNEVFSRSPRVQREQEDVEGWHQYDYVVGEHIPKVQTHGDPPFTYPLYARSGSGRVILLSNHHEVCNYFIDRDLRPVLRNLLRKVEIAVDELVLAVTQVQRAADGTVRRAQSPKSEFEAEWADFREAYTIGHAAAKTDAFHGDLSTVIFEGNNVSPASLFNDAIPVVRFYRCSLRKRIAGDVGFQISHELLKLGKTGFISFDAPERVGERRERFREVEGVLRALNRFGFIR